MASVVLRTRWHDGSCSMDLHGHVIQDPGNLDNAMNRFGFFSCDG